jgi:hypothetical protein
VSAPDESDHSALERVPRPDRAGTRLLGIHVDEEAHRIIKARAAMNGMTLNEFMHEALCGQFKAMGEPVPPILEATREEYRLYGRRRARGRG